MTPELVVIEPSLTRPDVSEILRAQGVPEHKAEEPRLHALAEEALAAYSDLSAPAGITTQVTREEFAEIYKGEGDNAGTTPLDEILPRSTSLSLFAVTLGEALSWEISRLFSQNDFAYGAMLDSAASLGADLAAGEIERQCDKRWRTDGVIDQTMAVMRFSPGYCGWHVTGQKKLFARLEPGRIGIRLNESCLMQPLKSVSGAVVAAPREAFDIDDSYSFCADCTDHSCRDRYAMITARHQLDHNRN